MHCKLLTWNSLGPDLRVIWITSVSFTANNTYTSIYGLNQFLKTFQNRKFIKSLTHSIDIKPPFQKTFIFKNPLKGIAHHEKLKQPWVVF